MKKNISILSIALVAGLFAAACDKGLEDCSKATKAADCIDSKKFKDEAKCAFEFADAAKTGDDDKGTCKKLADVKDAVEKACKGVSTTSDAKQTDCDDAVKQFKSAHKCAPDTTNKKTCSFTETK